MKRVIGAIALAGMAATASAKKDDKPLPRAEIFQQVVNCRSISDSAARLACYDNQVARLEEAAARKDVVIVDSAQVKKTEKGLFGFNLGGLKIFGGDDSEDGLTEIETTITSISQDRSGKWAFTVEEGAGRWVQIDTATIRTPKAGQKVKIRKAAMGSFFANINEGRAIRVKREN